MTTAIITAADGAAWEAKLVSALAAAKAELTVTRRCVDVVELAAVAASGQGALALVDAQLRRLDADIVERLLGAGIAVVGVIAADSDVDRLREAGIAFAIPGDAGIEVFVDVARAALAALTGDKPAAIERGLADPAAATGPARLGLIPELSDAESPSDEFRGLIVAVWGPTGAPGRTTVAINLAEEISRLGSSCLLIDADVYGGVVANCLGLLDESPGLVAACRQAGAHRLDHASLAALCWQCSPTLRVLTGTVRADRWPEVRPTALERTLELSRGLAECVVLDLGFALESDEELSFDTAVPRRNGATLAALDCADLVVAVGAADPIGLQRLVQGLDELHTTGMEAPVWVVVNKVRGSVVPGNARVELDAALRRFAGRPAAAFLPYDREGLDRATSTGRSLAETSPNSPFRQAVIDLAVAVCGRDRPARGRRRRRKSA
ncbi:MAG TPA: hypothetical protein VHO01_12015 [Jatrophihabitans sp.]|nr:hypothetical protein [Jatrophihabitans sp.]